jgi:hypothetical protein
MNLRSSILPLVSQCPAAAKPPSIPLVSGGPEADLGNAAHEALSCTVSGWTYDLEEIAERYVIEVKDLAFLVSSGRKIWEQIKEHFPNPHTEIPLETYWPVEDIRLTGHPDVFSVDGDKARILDWKSGRLDEDFRAQMLGYALLVLENDPSINEVWVGVARLREQTIDGETFTREQVEAWWGKLVEQVVGPEQFNPGRWCGYCPRRAECPAKNALVIQTAQVLAVLQSGPPPENGLAVRGWAIGMIHDGIKLLEPILERAKDMVRAETEAAGGSLPIGDGRTLVVTEEPRTKISFAAAEPVLRESMTPEALARCITLGKGKLEEEIRATAPYRGKTAAVKEVLDRLEAAGALTVEYRSKVEVRRYATAIETETGGNEQRPAIAGPPGSGS